LIPPGRAAVWLLALALGLAASAGRADEVAPDLAGNGDWHSQIRRFTDANRWAGIEADDPLLVAMELCSSPGCGTHQPVQLDSGEAGMLRRLFESGADSPQEERQLIAAAIALLEDLTGPRLGTAGDLPANDHRYWDMAGQLDCIAETINTMSYLDRLALAGLLRHHDVGREVIRFTLILQHIAVEIVDVVSNDSWVVDSWPGANGEDPVIEPYSLWRGAWQV